ncbi:hypothetical protein D3C73_587920 [compost metagenome]
MELKTGRIRIMIAISLLLAASLIAIFTIRVEVSPPNDTRIILERTYRTYITPPCFEQAKKTNALSESTLTKAVYLEYEADSSCTETSLMGVKKTIYIAILERLGLKESPWDW